MKLTEEQIEKVVEWWADRVAKPSFSALSDEERKNPREKAMQLAEMMAYMVVQPVTQEQREKFMEALRNELNGDVYRGLSVDYGPCKELLNAAKISGVSENNFPWKTDMLFRDNKIIARLGYDGEWEEL